MLLSVLSYTGRDNKEIDKDMHRFNLQRENIREGRQEGNLT